RTLRRLADEGPDAFYRGALAESMVDFSTRTGGRLTLEDLAAHRADWVEPLGVNYRGHTVHELPPNGQGIVALQALAVLEGLDLARYGRDDPRALHPQIEAIKMAFEDAQAHVADPDHMTLRPEDLLDPAHVARQRARIGETALAPHPSEANRGGTVYFCAADGEGQMVSFIQSNYAGFGSGVVVPGTGIALQNRGANFNLKEGHPNELRPGKRPYHTIIPGFLTRDGQPVGPFGVMGGFMQPQGHLQVIVNALEFGLNPQAALDAPRWQWLQGRKVEFEPEFNPDSVRALARMGHEVSLNLEAGSFGRGQIIWRHGETLVGASEPRADGQAVAL
ncbi:MAG TPA: gamma-glutamyltransferase, partial [Deinococcales bacterium]|nr:gamma-glutamyltransferase [Deinococcales bacterium]